MEEFRLPPPPTPSSFPPADPEIRPPVFTSDSPEVNPPVTSQSPFVSSQSVFSALLWALSCLGILLVLTYVLPYLAQEIQYGISRGRQRAEYETAGEALKNSSLKELSDAYQLVSQRIWPSVVHINTTLNQSFSNRENSLPHPDIPLGQGSGVIIDSAGFILTNRHVIRGAEGINVHLSDGRSVPAIVVNVDILTDLAVLKIEADHLIAAEWGDSDKLKVGAMVWAVGSPFGLEHSVTFGILSAKNRRDVAGPRGAYQDFMQTDADVNPGNSGGPLVDVEGRVVGINTAIIGSSFQGISFAIPSSVAREVFQRLKAGERVPRGMLGVVPHRVTPQMAQNLKLPEASGAYVKMPRDDIPSPARKAGIEEGDVIIRWNGKKVDNDNTLRWLVSHTPVSSKAEIVLIRDSKELTLQVIVGDRAPIR